MQLKNKFQPGAIAERYPMALVFIFTLRFVYQYFYSQRKHQSALPAGFWVISLIGSGAIIAYGLFRRDPVLILGQSFGFVAYIRNLMIGFKERKNADRE